MKAIKFFPLILFSLTVARAQSLEKTEISPEVQKAIDEFNSKRASGNKEPNEVVVVLEPPAPTPEESEIAKQPTESAPVLVNGKQPEEKPTEPKEVEETPAPSEPEPGLTIRVKSLKKGDGTIEPSKIKLKAPFAAKPLSNTPQNWILTKSPDAPAFKETVELRPGKKITLEIPPHILIPVSDGENLFSILEPGFKSPEGYRQSKTVNAILSRSITQLDEDSIQLSNALSDLHLLLASLPAPEPPAEESATDKK